MKTRLFLISLLVSLSACESVRQVPQTVATKSAAAQKTENAVQQKGPRVLAVVKDTGFREPRPEKVTSMTASGAKANDGVAFAGTARKAAKLSIASASVSAQSLAGVVTWCEGHDAAMRHHTPPISAAPSSARLTEENRNVSVDGWIHYAKKESDNDYHVIIGTSQDLDQSQLMNVEISGLPPHSSHAYGPLAQTRRSFETALRNALPQMKGGGYAKITPTHVQITGSLFYDIDHAAGVVGPTGHRAKSAWEIHPITSIALVN